MINRKKYISHCVSPEAEPFQNLFQKPPHDIQQETKNSFLACVQIKQNIVKRYLSEIVFCLQMTKAANNFIVRA